MERSFVEVWSLSFDDIGLIEAVNRSGRVWFAFQLSFFRERSRFPSRSGDVQADVLRYLAEQLGIAAPEARDFEYGHVTSRRHRAAILRHLGIRRATDRDRQAFRDELAEIFRGAFGKIEDQIELGYRKSRARPERLTASINPMSSKDRLQTSTKDRSNSSSPQQRQKQPPAFKLSGQQAVRSWYVLSSVQICTLGPVGPSMKPEPLM